MIRSRDDTIYSTTGYRDWTLQGTVIAPFAWADADTISLHTACANVPNRVIGMDRILAVKRMGTANSGSVADQRQLPTWTFAGSKGSVYTVTQQDRRYSCTCPGFQFRRQCRHVEQVREQQKEAA
jgi:hypothetical protein